MSNFYTELVGLIEEKKPSKEELSRIKTRLCKKHKMKKIPTDIEVLLNLDQDIVKRIKTYIITKPIRAISGVAVVAIMSKPYHCPHTRKGIGPCTMCPGGPQSEFGNVPMSYTGKEPATRRAIRNDYDPYLQVMNRLEQYVVQGHIPDKAELIIMGGTFPAMPKSYRDYFITNAFKAMNDFSRLFFRDGQLDYDPFKKYYELPRDVGDKIREKQINQKILKDKYDNRLELEDEQIKNEISNIRCIGLTIETRPDYAMRIHSSEMLRLGCTRVELGVQSIYDKALDKIDRGHDVAESIKATKVLKDLGFKINYHMMPGLPTVSYDEDLFALKKIFSDSDYRPDMLKIYPCMVLKGTKLYEEWKNGEFTPMTTKEAANLLVEFKKFVPRYVRIMRVQRDIPTFMTEAGVDKTNIRQYINSMLKERGIKCNCIRCREIGRSDEVISGYEVKVLEYEASGGREFFIEACKNDAIIGFCRLRFPGSVLRDEITENSALIRELHVYGEIANIGTPGKIQHRGIGKKLLLRAEIIASEHGKKKMVIISGVGVRNYYRKFGYVREGPYMVKKL